MSASSTYNLERLRVLCVDDNQESHAILKALLNAMNITDIQFCADTVDALETMQRMRPDVLLVDFEMRPLGGVEFVKLVRRDPESPAPEIPIIVTTGHRDKARIVAAQGAGAHDVVVKPVSAKGLYHCLANVIDNPRPFVRSESYVGPCRRERSFRTPEKRVQTGGAIAMNEFPANEQAIAQAI